MLLTNDGRIIEVILDQPEVEPMLEPVDLKRSYLRRNYYPNGELSEEVIIINDEFDGIRKQWHSNGKMDTRQAFRRGVPHGPRHMWGMSGRLLEEDFYVNGKQHGVLRRWNLDGQILLETNYEAGLPHGRNRIWFPNGQLQHEELFYKGFRHLTQKEWHSDGAIKCITEYKMGERHGLKRCWYCNGRIQSEEPFQEGQLDDIARYWNSQGQIQHRASYVRGRLNGEQMRWDETGKEILRHFYIRNVRIPARYEALIFSKKLKAKHIVRIKNSEVRRICLEALGYSQFLAQLPHEVIHRDGEQELVKISWHDWEEPIWLVKVRCPSTGAYYTLRVPPNMGTVKEAVAWTFGVNEKEYFPTEEA
jgi:antitoxin component YwqK of YwqJK toxin-antitoxin module